MRTMGPWLASGLDLRPGRWGLRGEGGMGVCAGRAVAPSTEFLGTEIGVATYSRWSRQPCVVWCSDVWLRQPSPPGIRGPLLGRDCEDD